MIILIKSKLLDEEIVILDQKSDISKARLKFLGRVLYFPPEIKELSKIGQDRDTVRAVHLLKKIFSGWIVPGNKVTRGRPSGGKPSGGKPSGGRPSRSNNRNYPEGRYIKIFRGENI